MENQNIEWQNWEEQPQQQENIPNWGEQPQQQENINDWGEQQPPEQPEQSWGNQPQQDISQSDFLDLNEKGWENKTTILGLLPKLKIEVLLYKFNYNDNLAVEEIINNGFNKINEDGKYKINYKENTELSNILIAIKGIGESRGMKLQHSYLYKNSPKESSINISKGECIYNYLYFLQGNPQSGDVVLDFSAINGPSEQVIQTTPGILLLLPGWVPYSITKNLSGGDMVAVAGRFTINKTI